MSEFIYKMLILIMINNIILITTELPKEFATYALLFVVDLAILELINMIIGSGRYAPKKDEE